jgi:hypothetical protein
MATLIVCRCCDVSIAALNPPIAMINRVSIPRLYLLVHNIDGIALRNEPSQQLLSRLADIPGVHLIASIDHILAPLLWNNRLQSRFQWLQRDCTTFRAYTAESGFGAQVVGPRHALRVLSLCCNH